MNALGMALRGRGDWPAAREVFVDLADDVTAQLGPQHPGSIIVRTNLAEAMIECGEDGQAAAAARLMADVLPDADAGLPATHTERVRVWRMTARARAAAGERAAAQDAWGEAVAAAQAIFGADDPRTRELEVEAGMTG